MDNKKEIVEALMEDHPITSMVKFDELNVQDKLKDISFQIIKYMDLHHAEDAKLKRIQDMYDKLCGIRYDYYRFDYDKELTKVEIEKYYLPKDHKVVRMKKILRRQEIKARFFEICFKGLEKQQWNMKTYSENMRRGF